MPVLCIVSVACPVVLSDAVVVLSGLFSAALPQEQKSIVIISKTDKILTVFFKFRHLTVTLSAFKHFPLARSTVKTQP